MSKPDCAVCGQPHHRHTGGFPNACPIIATYRPIAPPQQDVRARTIEECAKVADDQYADAGWHPYYKQAAAYIAQRIRALTLPGQDEGERT